MFKFLPVIKVITDELSLIDALVSDDDLTFYVLNGLGSELRDMVAPIRTKETTLSFAELHDLLIGHEHYIKRMDNNASALVVTTNSSQWKSSNGQFKNNKSRSKQNSNNNKSGSQKSNVVCQICDQSGYTAKTCAKLQSRPIANYATSTNGKWLIDSATSHNITSDLANLSIHSEYEGQDEVVLGDGTGLQIAHIGSTTLFSPSCSLMLKETLHVSLIHKNLIFVHKFTHDNNVTIEFHHFFYLVKDRMTGAVLMCGRCEDGVHPMALQSSSPQANQIRLARTQVTFDC